MSTTQGNGRRFTHGQGSQIFWGILSVIFAAASCYFFWQNRGNELDARTLRDQTTLLQEENQQLKAERDKLQSNMAQADSILKNRDEKLQEQASSLAQVTEKTQQLDAEHKEAEKQKQLQAEATEKWRQALQGLTSGSEITLVKRKDIPTLRILNSSLFASGEMSLKPDAQELLKKIGNLAAPQLKDHSLRLESFTDNDPIVNSMKSKYASNYELSEARAAIVARFLATSAKVPADRIVIVGRGEQFPTATNDTNQGKALNRRLEILLEPIDFSASQ